MAFGFFKTFLFLSLMLREKFFIVALVNTKRVLNSTSKELAYKSPFIEVKKGYEIIEQKKVFMKVNRSDKSVIKWQFSFTYKAGENRKDSLMRKGSACFASLRRLQSEKAFN